MSQEAIDQVRSIVKMSVSQVHGKPEDGEVKPKTIEDDTKDRPRKWKVWDLEFEAHMRMLDTSVMLLACIYATVTIFLLKLILPRLLCVGKFFYYFYLLFILGIPDRIFISPAFVTS